MKIVKTGDGVFYAEGDLAAVSRCEVAFLKTAALEVQARRARLCAHPDVADPVHEMIIVLARDSYVPPQKHRGRSESFHIVEGALSLILFEEDGTPVEVVTMGAPGTGRAFFCRISPDRYHMVVPLTDFVVFHETTRGPYDPADTMDAPWAPAGHDREALERFLAALPSDTKDVTGCAGAEMPPGHGGAER